MKVPSAQLNTPFCPRCQLIRFSGVLHAQQQADEEDQQRGHGMTARHDARVDASPCRLTSMRHRGQKAQQTPLITFALDGQCL